MTKCKAAVKRYLAESREERKKKKNNNKRTGRGKRGAEEDVGIEVFTAVTMKNAVFWDIKTQFVLHRRHITSPLQSPAS
jgi:hypothetical protein